MTYGADEAKWPRKKIPMSKEAPAEDELNVKVEDIRKAQKAMGEVLWLVTRTRPDAMFTVAKLSAHVLKNPNWVLDAVKQLHGYLAVTITEGVFYKKGEEKEGWEEDSGLEVFADASFSPGGQESHGAVVVMYKGGLLLWRSSRQPTVTLSTAEAELNEMIEGLMVGESVAAIIEEVNPTLVKVMVSDSQSAINICLSEGGSWRTRHLRLRAAHAKQRFVRGDWILRHIPGLLMLADLGTKSLPSARLEDLKKKLGMRKRMVEEGKVDEEKRESEDQQKAKEDEAQRSLEVRRMEEEVKKALKFVILMASFQGAKGQSEAGDQPTPWLQIFIVVFALFGVFEMARKAWNGMKSMRRQREPEEEPLEVQEGQRTEAEVRRVEGQRTEAEERRVEGQRTEAEERRVEGQRTEEEARSAEGQRTEEEVPTRAEETPRREVSMRSEGEHSLREEETPRGSRTSSLGHFQRDRTPGQRSVASSSHYEMRSEASSSHYEVGSVASSRYAPPPRPFLPDLPVPALPSPIPNRPERQLPEPEGESPERLRRRVRNRVIITRFGQRYHTRANCPTLANSRKVFSSWCTSCADHDTDELSPRIYARGAGETAHYRMACQSATRAYIKCQVCEAGGR